VISFGQVKKGEELFGTKGRGDIVFLMLKARKTRRSSVVLYASSQSKREKCVGKWWCGGNKEDHCFP